MAFSVFSRAILPTWMRALLAGVMSLLLHSAVIYWLFFRAELPVSQLGMTAIMVEFSNPPQSVAILHDLPIDRPQNLASLASPPPEEQKASADPESPSLDVESPPDTPVELAVRKKTQQAVKKVEKKVKKAKADSTTTRKSLQKTVKNSPLAETISQAGGQAATAPPPGDQDRIAAEFNSHGQAHSVQWQGRVKAHLARNLRYPEQALRKRWKGRVLLNISLDSKGNVLSATVTQSSGKTEFDREAIANATRSSPLPAPPAEWVKANRLSISVPIHFDYEKHRTSP